MPVERFPVDEGTIVTFAHAIGDTNPIYSDPAYAATTEIGVIIAPPTYVQSSAHFDPDYFLRPKPGQPWLGSGRTPTGQVSVAAKSGRGGQRGVGALHALHAEQHFEYHRHLRVGDVLSATTRPGEQWEKQGRSGKLVFSEEITDYCDQNGELVITARSIGVITEGPGVRSDA